MALKPRSAKKPSDAQVAALADKLADKQYGGAAPIVKTEKQYSGVLLFRCLLIRQLLVCQQRTNSAALVRKIPVLSYERL